MDGIHDRKENSCIGDDPYMKQRGEHLAAVLGHKKDVGVKNTTNKRIKQVHLGKNEENVLIDLTG